MKHVIIGVGAAGMTAAKKIRDCDKDAQITMISTEDLVHSRCMLHKYLSHERDDKGLNFTPETFFSDNKIEWKSNVSVQNIFPDTKEVVLESGDRIFYDKLLIATGANSFIPPVGDLRIASNVYGLRHLSDAKAIDKASLLAENIVIIGSGLVGLDAAYGLLERGKKVTVVEMADQILPIQLDQHAAMEYQKRFEQAGCRFLLERKASKAVCGEDGRIRSIGLDQGEEIPCDMIIVAAGVRPAVEFLEGSSIEHHRGVCVNEFLQTSHSDVYAAGDVTGLSGIWPNAMKQGEVAAKNMCGQNVVYDDTYAIKNTINFFGLVSLCIGVIKAEDGDQVEVKEDKNTYQRIVVRSHNVAGVLFQGDIANKGIWQYIIKNKVDISHIKKSLFHITYADFYQVGKQGEYRWKV